MGWTQFHGRENEKVIFSILIDMSGHEFNRISNCAFPKGYEPSRCDCAPEHYYKNRHWAVT